MRKLPGARAITIEAGKNLSYSVRSFKVRAGEPIKLTFINPDVGAAQLGLDQARHAGPRRRPGEQDHRRARRRQPPLHSPHATTCSSTPTSSRPQDQFTISFRAPATPGRYPYLCTFPGHWMVMNGEMIVE